MQESAEKHTQSKNFQVNPEPVAEAPSKIKIKRRFTKQGVHPFDEVKWEKRNAVIVNEKGEKIFEQVGLEFPAFWSQLATNVTVSKYFHGVLNTEQRETSLKQVIDRITKTITRWGLKDGYFDAEQAETFYHELTHLLLFQKAAFNSPVWFNLGIEERPQCSACFINSIQDTMDSILSLAKTEGMLFKYGSGTGTNLSALRSSYERLSSGGNASGPVSFMKGFDAFAGVIKSGGKTRRAAKMVILNIDHPDIAEFINCKANEEKKAWALIDAGYDGSFNGEAYQSVFFQNSNNSVRVNDEFMRAVLDDKDWETRLITTREVYKKYKARDLLKMIAQATHICGDPGLQFDSTINEWNPCLDTIRINASNPCSEYMFVDNSACNLASLNLMKFRTKEGAFKIDEFLHAIDLTILAQEILIHNSSYPTDKIHENSLKYRPLGLGYANLGALLMSLGLPYDSDKGRAYAAIITSLLTGEAYRQSAIMAGKLGPFEKFPENRNSFLRVLRKHVAALDRIDSRYCPPEIVEKSHAIWNEVYELGLKHGVRNAQVTVLAPTGTIGFLMDCDTTGIEPDIALVKYKKLVGGGMIKIVNTTVPEALKNLGYSSQNISAILDYLEKNDCIEGSPELKESDLAIFDCAMKPANGFRYIHYMGHIKMMAAVQPFISGAISKTVNVPTETTPEEIYETDLQAWKLGLKAIAIYRDGSKRTQPLTTRASADAAKTRRYRKKLPDERRSITHKFSIGGHEGYLTVGMYEEGAPGEIFIVMSKQGAVLSGLMDSFATSISIALQYGVPLEVLAEKFVHTRFEPSGFTKNPQIPIAKSVMDYIFRWLSLKFLNQARKEMPEAENGETETEHLPSQQLTLPVVTAAVDRRTSWETSAESAFVQLQTDAPPCRFCGSIMVRNASCYKCLNCGETSGCS